VWPRRTTPEAATWVAAPWAEVWDSVCWAAPSLRLRASVGMAFGYYKLAWSVYSNVIAKGAEVSFAKNAVLEVKFGGRPAGGNSVPKENPK